MHLQQAREAYIQAYTYYATGRYPVPHTPGKQQCFRKSLEMYERAGRFFEPPLEKVGIPFGDKTIPAYLRIPRDGHRHSVVINFGGIDSFKAESYEYDEALLTAGMGTCAVDMPGVGECPIKASTTADTLYSAVLDYLEKRPEVDAQRIAIMGRSFGGYWAAKMAFVEAKRLRASVVWGGGVHYFFEPNWLSESTNADSYLMDHDVARCSIFGVSEVAELAKVWPDPFAQNPGLAGETFLPNAHRERQRRSANSHCRSLHSSGIWHPKIRPGLPRRPHGSNAGNFADHHPLAKERVELTSRPRIIRGDSQQCLGLKNGWRFQK